MNDLTWAGHDFIATLKTEGVWAKIKATFTPEVLATTTLEVVKDAAMALSKEWFFRQLGLKP